VILRGDLPSPTDDSPGCRFASRCPLRLTLAEERRERCLTETPALTGPVDVDHRNACHFR